MTHPEPSPTAIAAHDQQRVLPAAAQQHLITGLAQRLLDRGCCLDAGAGSGMVTIPLRQTGIELVGLDRSRAMLDVFRSRIPDDLPLPLLQGDMRHLPFADATFRSVIVANVFHLIPDWQAAVTEVVRVLAPDRLLLVNLGGGGSMPSDLAAVAARFHQTLRIAPTSSSSGMGPQTTEQFEEVVLHHGLRPLPPFVVTYEEATNVQEVIHRLEHNVFARLGAEEATVRHAAEETRNWAQEVLGSLGRRYARIQRIVYRQYR